MSINNSEFRKDLVSGDWVLISPKRFKRPDQFKEKAKRRIVSKKGCPFEKPDESGNKNPSIIYPNPEKWEIQVVENKFPAVSHKISVCAAEIKHGPFPVVDGTGYHDVVITKDHYKNFAHLDKKSANHVFRVFKERYGMVSEDKCIEYIFIFHNWGPKGGASIFHPHYQILSLPIIPPDVNKSINGSKDYFKKNKRCVHCDMIKYEVKEKKRIVYENDEAEVCVPFVAREPFELRIFPKKHFPYFEKTPDNVMECIVDALQKALLKLEKKLGDPDYNFFIHTAPAKGKHDHYHWHLEILPKFSTSAGVELGTGIEITIVDPEMAAKILK